MKNIISIAIALVVAYACISVLSWILGNLIWLTFSIVKLVMLLVIATPIYLYARKRLVD
jgi:hypothetical protein